MGVAVLVAVGLDLGRVSVGVGLSRGIVWMLIGTSAAALIPQADRTKPKAAKTASEARIRMLAFNTDSPILLLPSHYFDECGQHEGPTKHARDLRMRQRLNALNSWTIYAIEVLPAA